MEEVKGLNCKGDGWDVKMEMENIVGDGGIWDWL